MPSCSCCSVQPMSYKEAMHTHTHIPAMILYNSVCAGDLLKFLLNMAHLFEGPMKRSCSEPFNEGSEQTLLKMPNKYTDSCSHTCTHMQAFAINHPLPIIPLTSNGSHLPFIKIKMLFSARTNCKAISFTAWERPETPLGFFGPFERWSRVG